MKRFSTPSREQGFALLFVFAMAAILAIGLYAALPRVTFEAQRDKEQLLIERGEQYQRAIQLYVRKFKRFPAKMEDLDNSNGIRFLRHHYTDPMTGKDEWRLIHAGPGGVLLDSLVKKADDKDKKFGTQSSITELGGVGGLPEADTTLNVALRKRPSDSQTAPGPGGTQPTAPGAPIPPDPPSGVLPATAGTAGGAAPPNPFGSLNPAGANGAPANTTGPAPVGAGLPVAQQPATPNAAGSAVNSQTGGISVSSSFGSAPVPGQTPVPAAVSQQITNAGTPGATPNGQGASDAAKLIGGLLTTPRPGGLAGLPGNATTGQTIGGGIAGVASTVKSGSGIKIYNDQEEYKKWEFVYDVSKEVQGAGAIPAAPATPGTPVGQQPAGAVGGGVFGPAPAPTAGVPTPK